MQLVFAFLLGACATAAATSSARPSPLANQRASADGSDDGDENSEGEQPSGPTVIPFDEAERRRSPSGTASIAILARGKNAFIGRLEMEPGGEVPEHSDATEEFVHVLQGGGTLYIDHKKYSIGPGTTIYMPADAIVRFEGSPGQPLVALQVFAGPEPANKYDEWPVTGVR